MSKFIKSVDYFMTILIMVVALSAWTFVFVIGHIWCWELFVNGSLLSIFVGLFLFIIDISIIGAVYFLIKEYFYFSFKRSE